MDFFANEDKKRECFLQWKYWSFCQVLVIASAWGFHEKGSMNVFPINNVFVFHVTPAAVGNCDTSPRLLRLTYLELQLTF